MFVGHYGPSFVLRRTGGVPLWVLFLAVLWGRRGGVVIHICVLSHWIVDLRVHVADLPLWGNEYKVGFGLWNRPVIAFVLEAGHPKLAIWIFAIVMLGIQYSNIVLPPPEAPTQFAVMALSLYTRLPQRHGSSRKNGDRRPYKYLFRPSDIVAL